mmetsp:Transcript_110637/g.173079  ORF Transcript_110637/g.173079 Transcript_110637/m.173079 type:complete len:444 (-) Transcript_110637:33-1364(-)
MLIPSQSAWRNACACSIFLHSHFAAASQGECAADGVICCVRQYQGTRNFYNEALGQCEALVQAEDCSPQERIDYTENRCVDISNAISAAVAKRTTTTSIGSADNSVSMTEAIDCGEHGTVDETDHTACICDEGWTSNELASIYCGISSIVQNEKIASMGLVEDNSGSSSLNPWDQITSRGLPFTIMSFACIILLCYATFRFCRWYQRRRRRNQHVTITMDVPKCPQECSEYQRHSFLGNGGWPGGMVYNLEHETDSGKMQPTNQSHFSTGNLPFYQSSLHASNARRQPGPNDQRFIEHALRAPVAPHSQQEASFPFQQHGGLCASGFGQPMWTSGEQSRPQRLPEAPCHSAYRMPQLPPHILGAQRAHAVAEKIVTNPVLSSMGTQAMLGANRVNDAVGIAKPMLLGKQQPSTVPGQKQFVQRMHPLAHACQGAVKHAMASRA